MPLMKIILAHAIIFQFSNAANTAPEQPKPKDSQEENIIIDETAQLETEQSHFSTLLSINPAIEEKPLINALNVDWIITLIWLVAFLLTASYIIYHIVKFPWHMTEEEKLISDAEKDWAQKVKQWKEKRDARRREKQRLDKAKYPWKQHFESKWQLGDKDKDKEKDKGKEKKKTMPSHYRQRLHAQSSKSLPKMKVSSCGRELLLGNEEERRRKAKSKEPQPVVEMTAAEEKTAKKIDDNLTRMLTSFYSKFWKPSSTAADELSRQRTMQALADVSEPDDDALERFDDEFFDLLDLPRRK